MHRFLVMSDSFKGTLSSQEICWTIGDAFTAANKKFDCDYIVVADGGEGTVDAFLQSLGGYSVQCKVAGPYFEKVSCHYGILEDNKTAVIEMASCAGLPLVEGRKNPLLTTTYGVGELILDAQAKGAKKIILGLGGSATNDGGCGMAAALGVVFKKADGQSFVPTGGTLLDIDSIDVSGMNAKVQKIAFEVMCDIDNSMYGPNGAAYIFGPQKGASPEDVELLDKGLVHLSEIIKRDIGEDVSEIVGGGAAGAMGAGMCAFLPKVNIKMGIDTILDTVEFNKIVKNYELVITGEGKLDNQSLAGKVVVGIAKRAKKKGVPILAIVGGVDDKDLDASIYKIGVDSIFTINRLPQDLAVSKSFAKQNLYATAYNIAKLIQINNKAKEKEFTQRLKEQAKAEQQKQEQGQTESSSS